jgi:hypothetical protein
MSYKARLSWFGWCLVALLLILNLGALAFLGVEAWQSLLALGQVAEAGSAQQPATYTGYPLQLVVQLTLFLILLNLALLPAILLSLRLRRTSDY